MRTLSMDERNAILAAQSRMRPVHEIVVEAGHVFAPLLDVITTRPDDPLNAARRLDLPEDVVPWMLTVNN